MSDVLQIGNKTIDSNEIPTILKRQGLWPQFLKSLVIEEAIADTPCSQEERSRAVEEWRLQNKLTSMEAWNAWMESQGMTQKDVEGIIVQPLRLEKFKKAKWGSKVEGYFMDRRSSLDQLVYSLLRTQNQHLARELYYRIEQQEVAFADCAREYSEGPEKQTGGLLGPVPASQPHPHISKLLLISQPGQLWPPQNLAEWFVIVRLEKFIPAQLDDSMRRRLIDEMYETWLKEQVQKIASSPSLKSRAASA
ncbi:MAG: peptidylprolyl isomerase [Oscillatoria sp. SIO1A7]|nr:peptidylprolyl isomerase [Oscillatoria sp. SIO1A7]